MIVGSKIGQVLNCDGTRVELIWGHSRMFWGQSHTLYMHARTGENYFVHSYPEDLRGVASASYPDDSIPRGFHSLLWRLAVVLAHGADED